MGLRHYASAGVLLTGETEGVLVLNGRVAAGDLDEALEVLNDSLERIKGTQYFQRMTEPFENFENEERRRWDPIVLTERHIEAMVQLLRRVKNDVEKIKCGLDIPDVDAANSQEGIYQKQKTDTDT